GTALGPSQTVLHLEFLGLFVIGQIVPGQKEHGHEQEHGDGRTLAKTDQGQDDTGGDKGYEGGTEPACDHIEHPSHPVYGTFRVPGPIGKGGSHGDHKGHIGGGKGQFLGGCDRNKDTGDHKVHTGTHHVEGGQFKDLVPGQVDDG